MGDDDDAIIDALPVIEVDKTPSPTTLPEPGGLVTFTVVVTNNSAPSDPVTITSLMDDVYGDIADAANPNLVSTSCVVPQVIASGGSYTCSFEAQVDGNAGDTPTDVVAASGTEDEGNPATASGTATVPITDVPPTGTVDKSASQTSVVEPGENVTFTVTVTNASTVETATLVSLVDSVYGDIANPANPNLVSTTCVVPQTLAIAGQPGDTYSCEFVAFVTGNGGTSETDVVTATLIDDDGNVVDPSDDAVVDIIDVPSSIAVDKSADPQQVPETGGDVTFTITVTNTSAVDSVTIDSVVDDVFGDISDTCNPALPATIAPSEQIVCQFTVFISGDAAADHVNVSTATGTDDDGNPVVGEDDEVVDLTPEADLEVTKTADPPIPEAVIVGEQATFTITVTNHGPSDATGVEVTETLPDEVTYVTHSGPGNFDPVTGVWIIGALAVGESVSLDIVVTVDEAGVFINVAAVTASDVDDPDPSNDEGEADVAGQEVLASALIGDTVWHDDNRNGIQDAGEPGIAGVMVQLTTMERVVAQAAVTDVNGKYLFAALEAGEYTVNVVLATAPSGWVANDSHLVYGHAGRR